MRPPRPPRDWLARALRSAAAAVDRLAAAVDREPHAPDHALTLARPAAGAADPRDPHDHATRPRPRRPGEPPDHWLRLVAAHAPGLLHDLPALVPPPGQVEQEVPVGFGPPPDANLLITEDGRPKAGDDEDGGTAGGAGGRRRTRGGSGLAADRADGDDGRGRAGGGLGRDAAAAPSGTTAGRGTRRTSRRGGAPHGDEDGGTAGGALQPDAGPVHPGPGTARSAHPDPALGTAWPAYPDTAGDATRPEPGHGVTWADPHGVGPSWPGRPRPGVSAGDPPHGSRPIHPGDDHEGAIGPAIDRAPAGRGRPDPAGDSAHALRVRLLSTRRRQPHPDPGGLTSGGEPTGRRDSSRSDLPGRSVGAGAARTTGPRDTAPIGPGRVRGWRWTGPAEAPPAPAPDAWPALPVEAIHPGVPAAGSARSARTGPAQAGDHPGDPWPALPDDRELWTPAAPTGEAAHRVRLDREQAGE